MRKTCKNLMIAALTVITLAGCSPWAQFYTDTSKGINSVYSGTTKLIYSTDGSELQDYFAKGYTTIGLSSFWKNGNVTSDELQQLGESKGADVVIYWRSNEHTTTYLYAQTHTTFQPSQTYVTGSANSTTMVTPVDIPSANYQAYFLRKGN